MARVHTIPGVVDVDSNFEPTQPELRVEINRERAADLGVSVESLATNLRTLVGGEEVSEFKDGDDQYVVRLRLDEPFRNSPQGIGDLLIPAGAGRTARVSDVAALRETRGPASIERYNRQRQISVVANIDRVPLGTVLAAAQAEVETLNLRPGYKAVFGDSARALNEASDNFLIAVVLAVDLHLHGAGVAVQQLRPPADDHDVAALSLPAGLLALVVCGMTLNIYSAIGLLMLFGVVKKNSILQVDYTNTLRERGMAPVAGADGGQPRPAAADPDDDDRDHRRDDSHRARSRRRCGARAAMAGHHRRRSGPVPAVDPPGDAGRLFVLRRPAGVASVAGSARRPHGAAG
jgi:HAE1 family hydrophobic/amphiphilic exporter-1